MNQKIKISLKKKLIDLLNKNIGKNPVLVSYFSFKKLFLQKENSFFDVKLKINSIRCRTLGKKPIAIENLSGSLFLKIKK